MQIPTCAVVKNGSIAIYKDFSFLEYSRNGKVECLRQKNNSVYKDALKQLKKYEEIPQKFADIKEFVTAHEKLYNLHKWKSEMQNIQLKDFGTMSKLQVKNCRKVIENLINTVLFNYDKSKSYKEQKFVTFVTLTLPMSQLHSDTVFRRLQTRFIENLQKTYNVDYYVWKAEAQQNGNIHFHLLIDRFVDKTVIQNLWNSQLDKYGYIDRFEKKHGHRNPPTTKIHGLVKIKNTVSYIMKYMTKVEKGKRPIVGQLWGCSNSVKKLDYPKFLDFDKEFDEILKLIEDKDIKHVFSDDYFSFYVGNMFKKSKEKFKNLWSSIKRFYKHILKPPQRMVEKVVETVEPIIKDDYYNLSVQLQLPFLHNDIKAMFYRCNFVA
ncbi:MAG: hypothetical protein KGV44_12815 [Flavobacteriaceae bacterium]|nr:hypothetical protein [Flavobacteriaceae bacterium]